MHRELTNLILFVAAIAKTAGFCLWPAPIVLLAQHYTRGTVSAAAWCGRCKKQTQHRVDDKRIGPCIPCGEKAEAAYEERKKLAPAPDLQQTLFHV